jgi:hypothetical protein
MVEFLKEAEDAIMSFHATHAGACTMSITAKVMLDILREKQAHTDPQSAAGYLIDQIQYIFVSHKGWFKPLNGKINNIANKPRSDPGSDSNL